MRFAWKTFVIVALAATMGLGVASAAFAEGLDAKQAAAAVGAAVDATPAASDDSAVTTTMQTDRVTLPDDPQQGVVVRGADGGPGIQLGLPADNRTRNAAVIVGSAVYAQSSGSSAIVLQPLDDGSLRAAVSISGPRAPSEYRYALGLPDGVSPVLNDGGGIDFVRSTGVDGNLVDIVVGGFEKPWATDANGDPVATRYTIEGDTVTQHVDFAAASAFPIVADPHIVMHWYGPGLKFSRAETGRIRNRAAAAALFAAICTFSGPETLGITCGVAGSELAAASAVASNAYGDHKCLELLWGFVPRSQGC